MTNELAINNNTDTSQQTHGIYFIFYKLEYLILLLFLLIYNSLHWESFIIPIHDSLQVYHIFHYFYCSVWFYGVVPEWMPYVNFGIPSTMYHCTGLTPPQYLASIFGLAFNIEDTLFVFKISVFLEQCIFISGMFWLSRLYLRMMTSRWIVYTAAVLGLDWWSQLWWNFRIYEYWPLIMASTLTFFQTRNCKYFWIALFLGITSMVGNLPYYLPVYFLLGLVYFLFLTWQYGFPWKLLIKFNYVNITGFTLVSLCVVLYLSVALQLMDGVTPGSIVGRDPETMKVTLNSFLTHAGNYDVAWMLKNYLLGNPVRIGADRGFMPDQTVYVGIVPVIFCLYGLSYVRSREFTGLVLNGVILLWFISGGIFAGACYYLIPAMTTYRYISFLWPFLKLFILMTGVYTLEKVIKDQKVKHLYWLIAIILFITDVLFNHHLLVAGWDNLSIVEFSTIAKMKILGLIAILALPAISYLIFNNKDGNLKLLETNCLKFGITVFCILDILAFSNLLENELAKLNCNVEVSKQLFNVSKMEYINQRTADPPAEFPNSVLKHELMLNIANSGRSQINQVTYNYLQYDPAGSEFFVPLLSKSIKQLINSRNDAPHLFQLKDPEERDRFLMKTPDQLFACYYPKLHLVKKAMMSENLTAAINSVNQIKDFNKEVVITNENDVIPADTSSDTGIDKELIAKIKVISFTPNRLKIELNNNDDKCWLVYSDTFHKNWTCLINEQPVKIWPGNAAFKAVKIDSQTKTMEFIYQNNSLAAPCLRLFLLGLFQSVVLIILMANFSWNQLVSEYNSNDQVGEC